MTMLVRVPSAGLAGGIGVTAAAVPVADELGAVDSPRASAPRTPPQQRCGIHWMRWPTWLPGVEVVVSTTAEEPKPEP